MQEVATDVGYKTGAARPQITHCGMNLSNPGRRADKLRSVLPVSEITHLTAVSFSVRAQRPRLILTHLMHRIMAPE